MACRLHPTNSPTCPGHTGSANSPKLQTHNFQPDLVPSPQSLAPAFLFPVPCICDPNHGEHKFPHFRCVIA
jgi:hypothetical protein